jgi:probable H4MPT-linked C1 transfer pathway protein
MTTTLGLDIGGANLKAANLDGQVRTIAFPMWQQHRDLAKQLRALAWTKHPELIGVTMTAEIADCFDCKADGVTWVIESVQQAFPKSELRVWLTTGEFAEPDDAVELPELVAAANWHALATWVGRAVPDGPSIMIDTGSTTTDIIPLVDGVPVSSGLNDRERLRFGELVYTGVRRTPLCAVTDSVVLNDVCFPLAAELFATTQDVHVVLGSIAEEANDTNTADGKPSTISAARSRIARMLCSDQTELGDETIDRIARQFADSQRNQLIKALSQVRNRLTRQLQSARREDADVEPMIVLSGSGAFLAAEVTAACGLTVLTNLKESASTSVAEAACAFAIAKLVFERCRDDLLQAVPFQES